jgi:hypothetical protein
VTALIIRGAARGDLRLADRLRKALYTLLGKVVPCALFGYMAGTKLARLLTTISQDAAAHQPFDSLARYATISYDGLAALFMGSVALLFLVRKPPLRKLHRPLPQAMALLGTYSLSLLALQPPTQAPWWLELAGSIVLAAGMACAVLSVLTLGRCFGILPEARGLVTAGVALHRSRLRRLPRAAGRAQSVRRRSAPDHVPRVRRLPPHDAPIHPGGVLR